jgi:hypothetical protein
MSVQYCRPVAPPPAETRYQRFGPAEQELLADFLTSEP